MSSCFEICTNYKFLFIAFSCIQIWPQFPSAVGQQPSKSKISLSWEIGPTGSSASFRGISTPNEDIIWLCGSRSTVLRSIDGGSSWLECSPTLGELEIRSIVAHSGSIACIASAGTPAVILRTIDSGKTWHEVYRHDAKSAFFDGMKFWNPEQGIAFSDPVDGKFLIVQTDDGGRTWQQLDPAGLPTILTGEAAFAASNSSLLIGDQGQVWIGTGGTAQEASRVHHRQSWQSQWQIQSAPIPSDSASGIFSLAQAPNDTLVSDVPPLLVAVGGDYRPEGKSPVVCVVSKDNGQHWRIADQPPQQFRSAVAAISLPQPSSPQPSTAQPSTNLPSTIVWVTVGPGGSDFSVDGNSWTEFSKHGFHALSNYRQHLFATGSNGRFAKLKVKIAD